MIFKRSFPMLMAVLLISAAACSAQNADLQKVLKTMDQQAASFRNAQADFDWDQYTSIVKEHDHQQGTIYFRRANKNDIQMMADIKKPSVKQVLFSDDKVRLYEPGIQQVTEYTTGKNKEAFEGMLVLGFGGSGSDLEKSFDVKFGGTENVGGVNAMRLDLTPKSPKVRNMFSQIQLWIDPAKGVSVQQKFLTPDGDYRLATYSNIVLNGKISDDAFKLKTTPGTKTIKPQG